MAGADATFAIVRTTINNKKTIKSLICKNQKSGRHLAFCNSSINIKKRIKLWDNQLRYGKAVIMSEKIKEEGFSSPTDVQPLESPQTKTTLLLTLN